MPEVIINGPDGRLECRYMPSEVPDAPTALILHPEPDKGGTMNNRVTYALYKHFQARGFGVLRFNFRGVGRSQGEYDNGEGELSDAATAMDWLQAQNPASRQCWRRYRNKTANFWATHHQLHADPCAKRKSGNPALA